MVILLVEHSNYMALNKIVNGIEVEMTADEESAIRAEWEANANKPIEIRKPSVEEQLEMILEKGIDGWKTEMEKFNSK